MTKLKKGLIATTVIALMALLAASCVQGPASTTTGEETNFRLLISDEPNDIGDFASLNVTIYKIGLQQSGEPGGWIYHDLDPKHTANLTELTGDNATEIFNGYVEPGDYTKVVIYTENVTGTLLDDGTATVKLPSDKLQISKPFTLGEDMIVNFVFDITVIKAGKSGQYILKPQIGESGPDQDFVEVGQEGEPHELTSVEGTISEVDTEESTISIIPSGDEEEAIVLNVNPQTEITLDDDEEATLEDLEGLGEGNSVTASYYLNNLKATEIDAESPPE